MHQLNRKPLHYRDSAMQGRINAVPPYFTFRPYRL